MKLRAKLCKNLKIKSSQHRSILPLLDDFPSLIWDGGLVPPGIFDKIDQSPGQTHLSLFNL